MSAAIRLEVFHEGQLVQELPITEKDAWVGRDQDCVIRLEDRAISRKHARLRVAPGGVEFEKRSKFGWARVNGKETTQTLLKAGDRVEMGPYEIRVFSGAEAAGPAVPAQPEMPAVNLGSPSASPELDLNPLPASEPAQMLPEGVEPVEAKPEPHTGTLEIQPELSGPVLGLDPVAEEIQQNVPASPISNEGEFLNTGSVDAPTKVFSGTEQKKAVLRFNDGDANVSEFELNEPEIAIGRSQQCHIVLEDKKASRKHTIIRKEGSKFFIRDLGSANGTLVNGLRVDDVELQSGDKIQIGETEFGFMWVQPDYEVKKASFIPVPESEHQAAGKTPLVLEPLPGSEPASSAAPYFTPVATDGAGAEGAFSAPEAKKKSLLGQAIDRYRAMNTRQQIIWGILVLAGLWILLEEEPTPQQPARLNSAVQKKSAKKEDGVTEGRSFESLTEQQQRYVETQYQLAFDLYKNREYDKALLEVGRIFALVQNYKNAREIEAFAREGKRKLEAQEEERKRKELERQNQLKLQALLDQARMLMDKRRFSEAEALFPEIELLQPENSAVNEWRKQIVAEGERVERERQEKARIAELNRQGWKKFQYLLEFKQGRQYQMALDTIAEIREIEIDDEKLIRSLRSEEDEIRGRITSERDPLIQKGRELEQNGQLAEAYRAYEEAHELDPEDVTAKKGMDRIRGTLTSRAKALYIEGVFAESYNDLEAAEKSYRSILQMVPKGDEYFAKAELRLKRITAFRKTASEFSP